VRALVRKWFLGQIIRRKLVSIAEAEVARAERLWWANVRRPDYARRVLRQLMVEGRL
jgi:hypothetical protein